MNKKYIWFSVDEKRSIIERCSTVKYSFEERLQYEKVWYGLTGISSEENCSIQRKNESYSQALDFIPSSIINKCARLINL